MIALTNPTNANDHFKISSTVNLGNFNLRFYDTKTNRIYEAQSSSDLIQSGFNTYTSFYGNGNNRDVEIVDSNNLRAVRGKVKLP